MYNYHIQEPVKVVRIENMSIEFFTLYILVSIVVMFSVWNLVLEMNLKNTTYNTNYNDDDNIEYFDSLESLDNEIIIR